jgi:hypothetical protein
MKKRQIFLMFHCSLKRKTFEMPELFVMSVAEKSCRPWFDLDIWRQTYPENRCSLINLWMTAHAHRIPLSIDSCENGITKRTQISFEFSRFHEVPQSFDRLAAYFLLDTNGSYEA